MFQDFLDWIKVKFKLNAKTNRPSFEEREIWWCYFGQNIGDEENGKNENFNRPVLILKKFNRNLLLVIPTSRQIKDNPYYLTITYKNQQYSVLISHIRSIDSKRLQNKIAKISQQEFLLVKSEIKNFL